MSRNGYGTYTIPNTFLAGHPITASGHNANWTDMGAEMTNSVAADGQTTMTGPLKAATGTATAPSMTFGGDSDTGRYRKSANTFADVCGGSEVIEYSTAGINVTGSIKRNGFSLLPVGLGPLPWSGINPPNGWILANGQALSRTTYADLWAFAQAEIGFGNALWSVGDGSTTFTVPDMCGRVAAGQDNMGGVAAKNRLSNSTMSPNAFTVGASGGLEREAILQGHLPSVNFPVNIPAGQGFHAHDLSGAINNIVFNGFNGGIGFVNGTNATQSSISINGAALPALSGIAYSGGSNVPFNKTQPTLITTYIIFAGV